VAAEGTSGEIVVVARAKNGIVGAKAAAAGGGTGRGGALQVESS
jgi:hypothetical protein